METACKNVVQDFRSANPKIFEFPFDSNHKLQFSIHNTFDSDEDERLLVVMSGAPEILIEYSTKILIDSRELPLDLKWRDIIEKSCKTLASSGERLFGVCNLRLDKRKYTPRYAFKVRDGKSNVPLDDMRFLGLISIIDPPRPGVLEAVDRCKIAGIKVVMITGDHPMTAKTMAKSVGIITNDTIEDIAENFRTNLGLVDQRLIKAAVITGFRLVYIYTL